MVLSYVARGFGLVALGGFLFLNTTGEVAGQVSHAGGVGGGTEGVSLLSLLDPAGRSLNSGTTYSGELTEEDMLLPSGEPVQGWSFEGRGGETVRIDLSSDDFDAYLYLAGPGFGGGISDDDGGDGLNSRICAILPADGRFLVVASALGGGGGRYTLSLLRERVANPEVDVPEGCGGLYGIQESGDLSRLLADTPAMGALSPDVEVTDRLGISAPRHPDRGGGVDIWEYEGRSGERIAFDLASDDFDTYLFLTGPGLDEVLYDDDGGMGCTGSRIWATLPASGTFQLLVTSFSEGQTGTYRLTATESPSLSPSCEWRGGAPELDGLDQAVVPPARHLSESSFPPIPPGAAGGSERSFSGVEFAGSLSSADLLLADGTLVQGWELDARSGERYRIELDSEAFDPYLILKGPGFADLLWSDDDGGGLNARMDWEVEDSGRYRIYVRDAGQGEGGDFLLRISRWGSEG